MSPRRVTRFRQLSQRARWPGIRVSALLPRPLMRSLGGLLCFYSLDSLAAASTQEP